MHGHLHSCYCVSFACMLLSPIPLQSLHHALQLWQCKLTAHWRDSSTFALQSSENRAGVGTDHRAALHFALLFLPPFPCTLPCSCGSASTPPSGVIITLRFPHSRPPINSPIVRESCRHGTIAMGSIAPFHFAPSLSPPIPLRHASQLWQYEQTARMCDSSMDVLRLTVQTPEGSANAHALLAGSSTGYIRCE